MLNLLIGNDRRCEPFHGGVKEFAASNVAMDLVRSVQTRQGLWVRSLRAAIVEEKLERFVLFTQPSFIQSIYASKRFFL